MKFEGGRVWITAVGPRPFGDVRVNIQRFVDVVVDELFNERGNEVVGDLGVRGC